MEFWFVAIGNGATCCSLISGPVVSSSTVDLVGVDGFPARSVAVTLIV